MVSGRLEVLRTRWATLGAGPSGDGELDLDSATDDEMFAMLDDELGSS
jgi:hypothetical protein